MNALALAIDELRRAHDPRLRSYVIKYSPDQPRVPAGNPDGGQWTREDGVGESSDVASDLTPSEAFQSMQYAALDTGTRTDATNADGASNSTDTKNHGAALAADESIVKPRGLIVAPGPASLDPHGLNAPLPPDEQQKIAEALGLVFAGNAGVLNPHPYGNRPTMSLELCSRLQAILAMWLSMCRA